MYQDSAGSAGTGTHFEVSSPAGKPAFKSAAAINGCNANLCIPMGEESPLSKYNSTAGEVPPPTLLAWMKKKSGKK